ncbi:hypothetical protein [Kitasatospora sp. NPDC058190]|uniref:hypothetical protein n=1 Tax=Kitasatospora sp. NPDC058190 TaxID=3346371 RepID=UPI0036DD255E
MPSARNPYITFDGDARQVPVGRPPGTSRASSAPSRIPPGSTAGVQAEAGTFSTA